MLKVTFLIIIVLSLFVRCTTESDGDNQLDNPVEGTWNNYNESGQLLNRKVYTTDRYTYFTIMNGTEVTNINAQQYIVNDNKLIFGKYTQTFRIDSDTLWITNSSGDQITKYIRFKNFLE